MKIKIILILLVIVLIMFFLINNLLRREVDVADYSGESIQYIIEPVGKSEYTVLIKKFKGKKLVKEQILKADGPIQNMNTLLFYLRKQPELKIGWHFTAK